MIIEGGDNIEIKIIGNNSSNRIKLLKNVERALTGIKTKIDVEVIENPIQLKKYGISNAPGLVINEKVVSQGRILGEREIKNFIKILC